MDAATVEYEAMRLPDIERAVLVEKLIESISSPSTSLRKAWSEECNDRMEALKSGQISLISVDEAISEVRQSLQR